MTMYHRRSFRTKKSETMQPTRHTLGRTAPVGSILSRNRLLQLACGHLFVSKRFRNSSLKHLAERATSPKLSAGWQTARLLAMPAQAVAKPARSTGRPDRRSARLRLPWPGPDNHDSPRRARPRSTCRPPLRSLHLLPLTSSANAGLQRRSPWCPAPQPYVGKDRTRYAPRMPTSSCLMLENPLASAALFSAASLLHLTTLAPQLPVARKSSRAHSRKRLELGHLKRLQLLLQRDGQAPTTSRVYVGCSHAATASCRSRTPPPATARATRLGQHRTTSCSKQAKQLLKLLMRPLHLPCTIGRHGLPMRWSKPMSAAYVLETKYCGAPDPVVRSPRQRP